MINIFFLVRFIMQIRAFSGDKNSSGVLLFLVWGRKTPAFRQEGEGRELTAFSLKQSLHQRGIFWSVVL